MTQNIENLKYIEMFPDIDIELIILIVNQNSNEHQIISSLLELSESIDKKDVNTLDIDVTTSVDNISCVDQSDVNISIDSGVNNKQFKKKKNSIKSRLNNFSIVNIMNNRNKYSKLNNDL